MTHPRRQRGMMFPVLVLLLALGGLGWLLARTNSGAGKAARELRQEEQTTHALEMARDALLGFAANYRNKEHPNADFGYLPCPDLDGDGSSETCGTQDQPSVGRLPYLTLNLPDLRDGAGECLWYAVAGSFKNNPKAHILNWDSIGQFRLLDRDNQPILLAGDPLGLAAAIVFAPGPPLPQQHRTAGQGRCGDDQTAQLAHYLETLGTIGNGVVEIRPQASTTNDRLISLSGGEIFRLLKRRTDYAAYLQGNLQAVADCLEQSGLPPPLFPRQYGLIELGSVPAPGSLNGPCTAPDKRDASGNWSEVMRYGRCSSGSACLSSSQGPCRGVLLFGGERRTSAPQQQRASPQDKLTTTQYLEAPTLTALSGGQLQALPVQLSLPFGASDAITSSDVALCLP